MREIAGVSHEGSSLSALAAAGLLAAPALAQTAKPADKAPAAARAGRAAKIRRAETIVDDNWTVTCAQTDQADQARVLGGAEDRPDRQVRRQRVMFTWVIGHQDGKLASAISVPSGVQIPPGMEIKIGDKESRKVGYSICVPDHCEALLPLEETWSRA